MSLCLRQRLHIDIVGSTLHDNRLILRNNHLLYFRNHLLLRIISLLHLLILLLRNLLRNRLSLLDHNLLLRDCLSLHNDLLLRNWSLTDGLLLRQTGYLRLKALLVQRLVNLLDDASLLRRHASLHLIVRNHDLRTVAPRHWPLLVGRDVLADSMRAQMRIRMRLGILVRLLRIYIHGVGWIILVLKLISLRELLRILVGRRLPILVEVRPEGGQQFVLLKLIFLH